MNDRTYVLYCTLLYCTFHACPVHFIAFNAYVVPAICCIQCTIFYNNNNECVKFGRGIDIDHMRDAVAQNPTFGEIQNGGVCNLEFPTNAIMGL